MGTVRSTVVFVLHRRRLLLGRPVRRLVRPLPRRPRRRHLRHAPELDALVVEERRPVLDDLAVVLDPIHAVAVLAAQSVAAGILNYEFVTRPRGEAGGVGGCHAGGQVVAITGHDVVAGFGVDDPPRYFLRPVVGRDGHFCRYAQRFPLGIVVFAATSAASLPFLRRERCHVLGHRFAPFVVSRHPLRGIVPIAVLLPAARVVEARLVAGTFGVLARGAALFAFPNMVRAQRKNLPNVQAKKN
mmetsp:Transcript_2342/g.5134  ORF Transcript_2342/g.5134 Transcript_2342/m.5134 type:complete len:243 (-) Transcript_2342:45-773(-)